MTIEDEKTSIFKSALYLRLIVLGLACLSYAVTSGNYILPAIVFVGIEITIWGIYFALSRKNRIVALGFWLYSCFCPELVSVFAIAIFCYGGIFRPQVWFTVAAYVAGLIYTIFIFKDRNFDENAFKKEIDKGNFKAWPSWNELDWFGKLYIYVSYVPLFPFLIMFGGAMWIDDHDPQSNNMFVLAGGYAFTFLSMALCGSRIWLRRVIRAEKA